MLNPYLNPYRHGSSSSRNENENENENGSNKEIVVTNSSSMGLQSQRRLGSVKKCLKKGSKAKYKTLKSLIRKKSGLLQLGVDGGQAFVSHRDCIVCRGHHLNRMGHSVSISHKPHDIRCGRNKSTRGSSLRTVQVNKFAKEMAAINTRSLSQGHTKGLPSVYQHFEKTRTTTTTITTATSKEGDKQEGKY
jgi:hypothetical protein